MEKLEFKTMGVINTDYGSIDIDVEFSMSRSFIVENSIDITTAFDPLVINLDGKMPQLASTTFSFDLDNDGEKDQISNLSKGNGFLALDKNNDGEINQGSELFGGHHGGVDGPHSGLNRRGGKPADESHGDGGHPAHGFGAFRKYLPAHGRLTLDRRESP